MLNLNRRDWLIGAAAWMLAAWSMAWHPSEALAQRTLYWSGTTGTSAPLWTTLGAWSTIPGGWTPPTAIPGPTDSVVFSLASLLDSQAVYLNGDQSALGLLFSSTTATTILGGTDGAPATSTLTLGSGGITVASTAGAVTIGTVGAPVTVALSGSTGQVWTNDSATTVTLGSPILRNAAATLSLAGAGTFTVTGATNTNGILGPWATTGTGASLRYVTVGGGGVLSAYSAATAAATAANVTDTTGGLNYDVAAVGTLGANASFNTLRYTGTAGTIAGAFSGNGLMNSSTNTLTMSGSVTIGATREFVVANTGAVTISGTIVNNAGGASSLVKTGNGLLTLSATNTFSGGTVVNGGTLTLNGGNIGGNIRGSLVINPGATVNASTWGLGYAAGTSVSSIAITSGTLNLASTSALAAASVTMRGGAITGVSTADWYWGNSNNPTLSTLATNETATISAGLRLRLNGSGNRLTFDVAEGTTPTGIDLLVSGPIVTVNTGDGTGGITKSGAGVLSLTGTNNYSGGTNINAGTFRLDGAGVLGSGTYAAAIVNNASFIANTARVQVLTGSMTGSGSVTQSGSGVLALYGTNSYAGPTTVTGGVLAFSSTSAIPGWGLPGTLSIPASATLAIPNSLTWQNVVDLGYVSAGTGMGFDTSAGNRTVSDAITGNRAFAKTGANTLTLTAANSFTGGATIAGGTLSVSSDDQLGAAGGSLTLANGGVLQVTGTSYTQLPIARPLTVGLGGGGFDIAAASSTFVVPHALSVAGPFTKLGPGALEVGSLTMNQQPLAVIGGRLLVGPGDSMTMGAAGVISVNGGAIIQTGGVLTANTTDGDSFNLGTTSGGYGYYSLANGSMTGTRLNVGNAAGSFGVWDVLSGGTAALNAYLIGGRQAGATGAYNIAGGTINYTGAANRVGTWGGGRTEFNVGVDAGGGNSGGTLNLNNANFGFAANGGGSVSILNLLTGGTLRATQANNVTAITGSGAAVMNFHGGTMLYSGAAAQTAFVSSANSLQAYVYSGGANFNDNGQPVTITANLLAPPGSGVLSIPVTSGGSGYIGSPSVTITGSGGGLYATGYAVVENGSITAIRVTNPGINYPANATVTLTGGTTSSTVLAELGTPVIGANTSGGLTKTGTGVLTLTGTNTYGGATTVSNGILAVTSTAALPGWATASNLSVASGAGLSLGNTFSDADIATIRGYATLAGGARVGFDTTAGDRTYGSALVDGPSGALGLTKTGNNTLTLTAASTFGGGTVITGGTLSVSADDQLGDASGGVAISNNAALRVTGTTFNQLGPSRAVTIGTGGATFDVTDRLNAFSIAAANIPVGGNITKVGNGILNFAEPLTLSGRSIFVNGGVLSITNNITGTSNTLFQMGVTGTTVSAVRHTSGTFTPFHSTSNSQSIGLNAGAFASYDLSTGAVLNGTEFNVASGTANNPGVWGLFNVLSGGTFTTNNWLLLGRENGSVGVLNLAGGTILLANNGNNGGHRGRGEMNLGVDLGDGNAGGLLFAPGGFRVQSIAGSNTGIANLVSGTLETAYIGPGATGFGTSVFNFHGGTLKFGGTVQGQPMTGVSGTINSAFLTQANVFSGGAIVDTNGGIATLSQNLLAPAGSGVTAAAVATGGSGYIAAPYVQITGGGGTNATAVAKINAAGEVTDIIVTNPGTGYTSAPTFTLVGGTATGGVAATVGTPTIAANVSGGVTKTGNGVLLLTGTNTYTGPTTIQSGALQAALTTTGLPTTSRLILDGGVFQGVGTGTFARTLGTAAGNVNFTAAGGGFSTASGTYAIRLNNGTGTLSFGDANFLPSGVPLRFGSPTAGGVTDFQNGLGLAGATQTVNVLSGTGGDSARISGVISGAGGLAKTGNGTLVLGAVNTFTGPTTVSQGILRSGTANALPSGAGQGDLTVASNATFDLAGFAQQLTTLSGSGVVDNSSATPVTLTLGANDGTGSFAGALTNSGSGRLNLTKIGSGTATLSGASTYTGTTTLSAGVLRITNAGALGNSTLSLGAGSLDFTGLSTVEIGGLAGSGTWDLLGAQSVLTNASGTFSGSLIDSLGGGSLVMAGGTQTLSGANITYPSPTAVRNGTLVLSGASGFASSGITMGTPAIYGGAGGGLIDFRPTGSFTYGNAIAGNGVVRVGSGTLVPSSVSVLENTLYDTTSPGTLNISGLPSVSFAGLAGNSNFNGGGKALTLGTGNISTTYSGTLSNLASLTKIGNGTLTLAGSNSFTGGLTINGGVVSVASLANGGVNSPIGASSSAASNLVLNGGVLRINAAATGTTDRLFTLGPNGGGISYNTAASPFLTFSNTGAIVNAGTASNTLTFMGSTNPNVESRIVFAPRITDPTGTTGVATSVVRRVSPTLDAGFTANPLQTNWRLTNTGNSYSGGTYVYGGSLYGESAENLPGTASVITVTNNPFGTGPLYLYGGQAGFGIGGDNANVAQTLFANTPVMFMNTSNAVLVNYGNPSGATSGNSKRIRLPSLTVGANAMGPASTALTVTVGAGVNQFGPAAPTAGYTDTVATLDANLALFGGNVGNFLSFLGGITDSGKGFGLSYAQANGQFITMMGTGDYTGGTFIRQGGVYLGRMPYTPVGSESAVNLNARLGTGPIVVGPSVAHTSLTALWVYGDGSANTLAAGQSVDFVSSRSAQSATILEGDTFPSYIRSLSTGVFGISGTSTQAIDQSRFGDGTWQLGGSWAAGASAPANTSTFSGSLLAGAGNAYRLGGSANTLNLTGSNILTGNAGMQVGLPMFAGQAVWISGGTVNLNSPNDYTGPTTVFGVGQANQAASTLRINAASLGSGPVTVLGTLQPENAGGVLYSPAGLPVQATLMGGGRLIFESNSALNSDRYGDATPLPMFNAQFDVFGRNGGGANTNEIVGTIEFAGGNFITPLHRSTSSVTLTVGGAGLVRQDRGTVQIAAGAGQLGALSRFYVANSAAFTPATGGSETVEGTIVKPYIINSTDSRFLTYDGVNGFTSVAYGSTNSFASLSPTSLVSITAATAGATSDFLGLNVANAAISDASATLTLRSGGVITTGTARISPTLQFASQAVGGTSVEGVMQVISGTLDVGTFSSTINVQSTDGQLRGTEGLTKSGNGILRLNALQPNLTGPVTINRGYISLFQQAGTAPVTPFFGPAGTVTDVRIATAPGTTTVGGMSLFTNASYTWGMNLTVAENMPVAYLGTVQNGAAANANLMHTIGNLTLEGISASVSPAAQAQGQTFFWGSGNQHDLTVAGTTSLAGNVTIHTNADTNHVLWMTGPVVGTAVGDVKGLTKTGVGVLVFGTNNVFAPNTQFTMAAGQWEWRSSNAADTTIQSLGNSVQALTLQGGQLNLRTPSQNATFGTTGTTGYAIRVAGDSTISVDRTVGSSPILSVGDLSIGNQFLAVTGANAVTLRTAGVALGGRSGISGNNGVRFSGLVSGGSLIQNTTAGATLFMEGANNTFDGGTTIQYGTLRAEAAGTLGTGAVTMRPGSTLYAATNAAIAASGTTTQLPLGVYSSAAAPATFVLGNNVSNVVDVAVPTFTGTPGQMSGGIIALKNTVNGFTPTPLDFSTIGDGTWFLGSWRNFNGSAGGGNFDARYTADTLGAGAGGVYRLGGNNGGWLVVNRNAANNQAASGTPGTGGDNLLTGANAAVFGPTLGNLTYGSQTLSYVQLMGRNDYTGGTLVNRGVSLYISAPVSDDQTYSALGSGRIDVLGGLRLRGLASFAKSDGSSTNEIVLHPQADLELNDSSNLGVSGAAAYVANRLGTNTNLDLGGGRLYMLGNNVAGQGSTQTLSTVTVRDNSWILLDSGGANAPVTLSATNLVRGGAGDTLTLYTDTNVSQFGATTGNIVRFTVTGSAPAVTNGMVDPWIAMWAGSGAHSFATYDPAVGFKAAAFDRTVTTTADLQSATRTQKVSFQPTVSGTLTSNVDVYALQIAQATSSGVLAPGGVGADTVTIRSGGLTYVNTVGNQQYYLDTNLRSLDAEGNPRELVIWTNASNNYQLFIRGQITADGVVKAGQTGAIYLTIAADQPTYSRGWTVNDGVLRFDTPGATGTSDPANVITLNGYDFGNGSGRTAILDFNFNPQSPETYTIPMGKLVVNTGGQIRNFGNGDDRSYKINVLELTGRGSGTGSPAVSGQVRFDIANRQRSEQRFGTVSVLQDYNVIVRSGDTGSNADPGRMNQVVFEAFTGTGRTLLKSDSAILTLGDGSGFTGGQIVVANGPLRVTGNTSFGSATTGVTVQANGVLEIGTANFQPTARSGGATITQVPGSYERWLVDGSRFTAGGSYAMPTGVTLQLAASQVTSGTLALSSGGIEPYMYTDDLSTAVLRVVGQDVTLDLTGANTFGQSVAAPGFNSVGAGAGLLGRGNVPYPVGMNVNSADINPISPSVQGATMEVLGRITGSGSLVKVGRDLTILSGTSNTYAGATVIEDGFLRTSLSGALPATTILTPKYQGSLDLAGTMQTVANLGVLDGTTEPGTGLGYSGHIVNSAIADGTLIAGNAANYTFSGDLLGRVALVKQGTGSLTLAGTNRNSGGVTIAEGSLVLAPTGSLLASSSVTLGAASSSGKLVLGNAAGTGNQSLAGLATTGLGGSVVGGNAAVSTLTLNQALSGTFAGRLGGAGANENNLRLSKAGNGTLTLAGTNSFSGGSQISGGVLAFASADALPGSGSVSILSGGALAASGPFAGPSAWLASGRIDTASTGALALTTSSSDPLDFTGFSGLSLGVIGSGTVSGAITPSSGGYRLGGAGGVLTVASTLTGASGLSVGNPGTVILTGSNDYSGGTTLTAGTLQLGDGGTTGSIAGNVANGAALVFNRSDAISFAGAISGTGSVGQIGSGVTTLAGSNGYTGATSITGGVLAVSSLANGGVASGIGAASADPANLVISGGTLRYTGAAASTNRGLTIGTAGGTLEASGSAAVAFTGTVLSTGSNVLTLTGTSTAANSLTGVGNGGLGLTSVVKTGPGRWVFTGQSGYTGQTSIQNGSLQLAAGTNILNASGTVALGAASTSGRLILGDVTGPVSQTLAAITVTGSGGSVVGGNTANSTLTFNNAGALALANGFGGAGTNENNVAISKLGGGTLTLSGTNTHTGGTRVAAGTVNFTGQDSVGSGGVIDLAGGSAGILFNGLSDSSSPEVFVRGASMALTAGNATVTMNRATGSLAQNKTMVLDGFSMGSQQLSVVNSSGYGLAFTGSSSIVGSGTISVGTATISSVVQGLSLGGPIAGTATGLTKIGNGTLVLGNAANTFTGNIAVNAGVVAAVGDGSFGDAANQLTFAHNTTLRGNASFTASRTMNLSSGTTILQAVQGSVMTLAGTMAMGSTTSQIQVNDNGAVELASAGPAGWTASITAPAANQTLTGGVLVNSGALRLSHADALGAATNIAAVNTAQGSAIQLAGGVTIANPLNFFTLASSGGWNNNGFGGLGQLQSLSGSNRLTSLAFANFTGNIGAAAGSTLDLAGGVTARAGTLGLLGDGDIVVSGGTVSAVLGLYKFGSGTTTIAVPVDTITSNGIRSFGGGGVFALAGSGSVAGTQTNLIYRGDTLRLDNAGTNVVNRLGGVSQLHLVGGAVEFVANADAPSSESTGLFRNYVGNGEIRMVTSGQDATLTFASMQGNAIDGGSSLSFRTAGTEADFGTPQNRVLSTAAPAVSNGIVSRGFVYDSNGVNRATYVTGTGFVAFTNYATDFAAAGSTANVRLDADAAVTTIATKTINSLKMPGGVTLSGSNFIFSPSNGILATGGTSTIGAGLNVYVNGEVLTAVDAGSTLQVDGVLSGLYLNKSLGGTLVLAAPQYVAAANHYYLNGGTTRLAGGNQTLFQAPAPTGLFVSLDASATLDLGGNNQLLGGLRGNNNDYFVNTGVITSAAPATLAVRMGSNESFGGRITGAVSLVQAVNGARFWLNDNSYTGRTAVVGGIGELRDYGRASQTSAVDLAYGMLSIRNDQMLDIADRVADTAPVTLRGGQIHYYGRTATNSTEVFGPLSLTGGYSQIRMQNANSGNVNSAEITFASLARPEGSSATLNVNRLGGSSPGLGLIGNNFRVLFAAAPTVTNNILGGWAINDREFASYLPGVGVGALNTSGFAGYSTATLATSGSNDNVRIAPAVTTLTSNATAYTLNLTTGGTLALGGNTLTLTGGGLMLGTPNENSFFLSGGSITAGAAGTGGDLYLHHQPIGGTARKVFLSGTIADNAGGPVRLVLNSSEALTSNNNIVLSGANSHTGGTVINGAPVALDGGVGTVVIPAGSLRIAQGSLTMLTSAGQIDQSVNPVIEGGGRLTLVGDNTLAGLAFENLGAGITNITPEVATGGILTLAGGITATSQNPLTLATVSGTLDFGGAARTISVAPITYAGQVIAETAPTLVMNGVVQNAGQLSVTGGGVLLLSNSNSSTFSGGYAVAANTALAFGTNSVTSGNTVVSGPLGVGTLSLASGARLFSYNGTTTQANVVEAAGDIRFEGVQNLTLSGPMTLVGSGTYTVDAPLTTITFSGSIAGSGRGFTKAGYGTLLLSGSGSTFDGDVKVAAGVLQTGSFGLASATFDTQSGPAGRLSFGTLTAATIGGLKGSNNLSLTNDSNAALALTVGANNLSTTFTGTLTGAGSFTKVGTGVLTMTGSHTFTGITTIANGLMDVDTMPASGPGPFGSGTTAASLVVNGGGIRYIGAGETTTRAFTIGTSGGTLDASGSGPLVLSGSLALAGSNASRTVTLGGSSAAENRLSFALGNNGSGQTSIAKTGVGRWVLDQANTFSGQVSVLDGELVVGANVDLTGASPLGTSSSDPVVGSVVAGATGDAALLLASGVSLNRAIAVPALGAGGSQRVILGGVATSGTARFLYEANMKLDRDVTLQAGTGSVVEFGNLWSDPSGSADPTKSFRVGTAANAGMVVLSPGNSGDYTGFPASYLSTTGSLDVDHGVLKVAQDYVVTLGGPLTVHSGATLAGSGTIAALLAGSGLVGPGSSPGILTAAGIDPTTGLDFAFEFTATGAPTWSDASASINDLVRITGTNPFTAALTSGNVIDVYFPGSAGAGQTYLGGFFTDQNSTDLPNFAELVEDATFQYYVADAQGTVVYNGLNYSLLDLSSVRVNFSVAPVSTANFASGTVTNGQVTQFVIVVPEPAAIALAAIGIAAAARLFRRRSR